MNLPLFYVDDVIKRALAEDINYMDVSTVYVIPEDMTATAYFLAKADGILCGMEVANRVFELLDPGFQTSVYFHDGDTIQKGDIISRFSGKASALLQGERTALNLLQHMSGVATATAKIARQLEGTNADVAETRKTLPGLRALQKYAVTCGGGRNHRFNLSDAVMLKDNHIDAGGGISATVSRLRKKIGHTLKIEVETRNLAEVREALSADVDIIMLDNMDCEQMTEAVKLIDGRALTEASGNITEETAARIAACGVDILSVGALTHSVHAFDISMKIELA